MFVQRGRASPPNIEAPCSEYWCPSIRVFCGHSPSVLFPSLGKVWASSSTGGKLSYQQGSPCSCAGVSRWRTATGVERVHTLWLGNADILSVRREWMRVTHRVLQGVGTGLLCTAKIFFTIRTIRAIPRSLLGGLHKSICLCAGENTAFFGAEHRQSEKKSRRASKGRKK